MAFLDKLLISLLLLLLPLGAFGIWQMNLHDQPADTPSVDELRQLISEVKSEAPQNVVTSKKLTISSVGYASESGVVRVAGTAPQGGVAVMVSATVLPHEFNQPVELANPSSASDGAEVLGQQVVTRMVPVSPSGVFVLEYPVGYAGGIVEFHLNQASAQTIVQYDLDTDTHEVW